MGYITIDYKGIELYIGYITEPAEGDGFDSPRIEESLTIETVRHFGDDLKPLLSETEITEMEDYIINYLKESGAGI